MSNGRAPFRPLCEAKETSLFPEPHQPRASGTKGRSCPLEPRPFHGDQAGFRAPLESHDQPYADWMRTMVFAAMFNDRANHRGPMLHCRAILQRLPIQTNHLSNEHDQER